MARQQGGVIMWNNSLSPYMAKSLVVTITDDCDTDAEDAGTDVDGNPTNVQVLQVLDGTATVVVAFDNGETESYQLPVGGLTLEETTRYLTGLDAEDLVELLESSDEDDEDDDTVASVDSPQY